MSVVPSIDPVLYDTARQHASRQRAEIQVSTRCAWFFCFHTFPQAAIKTWIDSDQTALCPACGIDAVIGDASKHRLDDRFLRQMHTHSSPRRGGERVTPARRTSGGAA